MSNHIVIDTLTREYGEATRTHRNHVALPVPEEPMARGQHAIEQDRLCGLAVAAKRRLEDAIATRRGTDEVEDWYVATRQDLGTGTEGEVFADRRMLLEHLGSPLGAHVDRIYLVRNFAQREDITRKVCAELLCDYLATGQTIDDDRYPRLIADHMTRDEMLKLVRP